MDFQKMIIVYYVLWLTVGDIRVSSRRMLDILIASIS